MIRSWPTRVHVPDGQIRDLYLEEEPREGETLKTDELPGVWVATKVESNEGADRLTVKFEVRAESVDGVGA